MTSKNSRGFSLLEMMIVVAIGFTVAGISMMALQPLMKQNRVETAYSTVLSTLRTYRNKAVTERKRYIVSFTAPQTITVQYWAVATPVSPPPVTVATYTLPVDMQFGVIAGFPSSAATVPDGFGTGSTAIDFDQGMGLGSQNYVMFMPDGSSQDTLGNLNSGVVYISRVGELYSGRAVTVFGSTGRIRGWHLYNTSGTPKWVQQ